MGSGTNSRSEWARLRRRVPRKVCWSFYLFIRKSLISFIELIPLIFVQILSIIPGVTFRNPCRSWRFLANVLYGLLLIRRMLQLSGISFRVVTRLSLRRNRFFGARCSYNFSLTFSNTSPIFLSSLFTKLIYTPLILEFLNSCIFQNSRILSFRELGICIFCKFVRNADS